MYLRLLLPEILPGYRRILYLDSDIVPAGPVGGVLRADLRGQAVGAVRDVQQWRTPRRSPSEFRFVGLPPERYMNSGVLLFDTERWCKEGWTRACIESARDPRLAKAMLRNDQSAINLALRGQWTELSPVWNWQWTEATRYFADDAGARLNHFIGPRKPWRTSTLPPRFTSGYAPFLQRFFPDAPAPPERPPRVDRHRRAFLRHWLRAPAMQAYLDRFPDPLTTVPPGPAR
jgi:lipopolysaccharide biosynthesis glycosyltransferase